MENTLILVDGSSYFYRAFHALPPLQNSKGQPLGAVYGVINMVRKLLTSHPSAYFAIVFDAKGKTFRDELYADYKATRPPMPDELSSQFKPMLDILEAMGFPILINDGVEADDVIGSLCKQAKEQGLSCLVSTGDKDLAQLVDDKTTLINTMTGEILDIPGVQKKFNIKPQQIIDYLALIGDKSDNVPGVPKVGPKTAVKWLDAYGDLDGVVANKDEISGKVGENLRENLTQLALSKQLVTIKTDLNLNIDVGQLKKESDNVDKIIPLLKEYEFNTLLKKYANDEEAQTQEKIKTHYQTIQDVKQLESWLDKIRQSGFVCIDTETDSLEVMNANLVGVSLAVTQNEACYIPCAHQTQDKQLDRETLLAQLRPILEDAEITKVGQNLKYDINVLRHYGLSFNGPLFDTMLESYILNSTQSRHDMDSMAQKYLGLETIKFEEVAGKGKNQKTFDEIALAQATEYAAEDADITLKLHHYLSPRVKSIPKLKSVFLDIEMPLMQVLADMEYKGVLIDQVVLKNQGEKIKSRIDALQAQAFTLAGEEFNLASPKQLQAILFEKLSLPIIQKTPKGQPSTAENVLQELAYEFELPKIILEHRSLSKLLSTYIEALPKKINQKTGRVHTSYNQAVTATGRLSSSDPNLQNIPIRKKEGREIRHAFIARPGYQLLAADYSQIELRIMAHLSQDKSLLEAFANNLDIHRATASEVFDVAIDKVTEEQRRSSKAVNFGLIYGMSAFGLAKQLQVSRTQAQEYIDLYFSRYPGVKRYMEDTRALAHEQGYVETLSGRRLYLPDIKSRNKMLVNAAERTAINAPMQGTAAEIIKRAMIDIFKWQQITDLDVAMIMQVHDELVFEIKAEDLDKAQPKIKSYMESAMTLDVPLLVEMGVGKDWEAAH